VRGCFLVSGLPFVVALGCYFSYLMILRVIGIVIGVVEILPL
jgi:hypothetical protein